MAVVRKKTKTSTSTTARKPVSKTSRPATKTTRTATKSKASTSRSAAPTPRKRATPNKPTAARARSKNTSVKEVAKPKTATTRRTRDVDETTGFVKGTDSHLIAMELLKGGESRSDIVSRCAKKLPPLSNRGTPKPVANLVASVISKMRDAGFIEQSSFALLPPTRASKAKATRARNQRVKD